MGTTQMFTGLAREEEWFKDKVSIFVALGPVTKITNTTVTVLQIMDQFYREVYDAASVAGAYNLFPRSYITQTAMDIFCTHIDTLCKAITGIMTNDKSSLDNDERYKVYMGHMPNGVSAKSLLLYAQNMQQDRFQVWADHYLDWIGQERQTERIKLENIS